MHEEVVSRRIVIKNRYGQVRNCVRCAVADKTYFIFSVCGTSRRVEKNPLSVRILCIEPKVRAVTKRADNYAVFTCGKRFDKSVGRFIIVSRHTVLT